MTTRTVSAIGLACLLCGCNLAALGGSDDTEESSGDGDGDALTPEELEKAKSDPTICVPGIPATSQLPRLTRAQFDNTVRDLLGITSSPSAMLAPDSTGSVDQRAWNGYQLAARTVAEEVMAAPSARALAIGCTPSGDGVACAQEMVTSLGKRAFRRPLTPEEVTRFGVLIEKRAEITPTGTFDELAQLLIEAFLLSPSFVIRAEIAEQPEGDYFSLSAYEVASRLSYMLWDSMPDDVLFAAAEAGELATSEGLLAQASRMLADGKARHTVAAFHEHYMHMGPGTRWEEINRDPALFPEYQVTMGPLLSEETSRFVEHVVFDLQGTFKDLVLLPVGFVNAQLAPLYDLDPSGFGTDLVATPLDPTQRAGLFTRLGFLASHSYYDRSSPIHRGAFLQKEVLCAPVGTPPPGAEGEPLPTEGLVTNRARVDAQTGAPGCKNCHHSYINPAGFALEAYDAVGALQTVEAFSGAAIDTGATVLIGEELVDVDGPIALSEAIAQSEEASACYARKWVEYAYRRAPNNQDSCVVEDMTDKLTEGGYTVLNLIADLTQSDSFRLRAMEVGAGQ